MQTPTISMIFDDVQYPNVIAIIGRAIAYKAKPAEWRLSEYAMTKMSAQEVLNKVKLQRTDQPESTPITLTYFEWGLIIGEIARLYQRHDEDHEQILAVFVYINDGMKKDIGYSELLQTIEAQGVVAQEMAAARKTLEEGEHRLWQLRQKVLDLTVNKPPRRVAIKMRNSVESNTDYGMLDKGDDFTAVYYADDDVRLIVYNKETTFKLPVGSFDYV